MTKHSYQPVTSVSLFLSLIMTLTEKGPQAQGQVSIKSNHILVNTMPSGTREGIMIARTVCHGLPNAIEVERPHRDNGHLFILQEKETPLI